MKEEEDKSPKGVAPCFEFRWWATRVMEVSTYGKDEDNPLVPATQDMPWAVQVHSENELVDTHEIPEGDGFCDE